jgi:hypothetical protein
LDFGFELTSFVVIQELHIVIHRPKPTGRFAGFVKFNRVLQKNLRDVYRV